MRVFITGATGFLGYHIAVACVNAGHDVLLLRRFSSHVLDIKHTLWVVQTDDNAWRQQVEDFSPEVLIHTAWGGVAAGERNNAETQKANVEMTKGMYNLYPYKQIIALGSQDEYGQYSECVDETHPLKPISKYAKAKIECCNELGQLALRHPIEWQWIRVFSMYGERQQDNWLIPSIIRRCLRGERVMQTTLGEQQYSYLYAQDFAAAIVSIIGQQGKSGIYNIASKCPMKLRDVFEAVKKACRSNIVFDRSLPYRENQTMVMLGSCSKFVNAFGEYEKTPFEQGLNNVITYMKEHNEES